MIVLSVKSYSINKLWFVKERKESAMEVREPNSLAYRNVAPGQVSISWNYPYSISRSVTGSSYSQLSSFRYILSSWLSFSNALRPLPSLSILPLIPTMLISWHNILCVWLILKFLCDGQFCHLVASRNLKESVITLWMPVFLALKLRQFHYMLLEHSLHCPWSFSAC